MKRAIKTATIFDDAWNVYELEDGEILLSKNGAVRAPTATAENRGAASFASFDRYIEKSPSKYTALSSRPVSRFIMPQGGTADGITPDMLLAIMRAYSEARDEGEILAA